MNHKHEALWPLKKCTLYIFIHIDFITPFHLTIESSSTLIQNEL
jgi:hypothetical protein